MSGLLQMLTGHGARGCGVLAWLVLLRFCAPEEPLPPHSQNLATK